MTTAIGWFPLETISLLIGIIVPIAGVAYGLGVLQTKLNQQREEMKIFKEKVDGLGSKLDAYLLAAEELNELRREQTNQQREDMKKLKDDTDVTQKKVDSCLLDIKELKEQVGGQG
jgi:peptidoglycan hydrolase CwlO-like protein